MLLSSRKTHWKEEDKPVSELSSVKLGMLEINLPFSRPQKSLCP